MIDRKTGTVYRRLRAQSLKELAEAVVSSEARLEVKPERQSLRGQPPCRNQSSQRGQP